MEDDCKFPWMFQTAMVEEDVTDGFSTVVYTPGHNRRDDGMYINTGSIDRLFFAPENMVKAGH